MYGSLVLVRQLGRGQQDLPRLRLARLPSRPPASVRLPGSQGLRFSRAAIRYNGSEHHFQGRDFAFGIAVRPNGGQKADEGKDRESDDLSGVFRFSVAEVVSEPVQCERLSTKDEAKLPRCFKPFKSFAI